MGFCRQNFTPLERKMMGVAQGFAQQLTLHMRLIDLIEDFRPDVENGKIISITWLVWFRR